jgi:DNA-binding MarR family transcriptional regulator
MEHITNTPAVPAAPFTTLDYARRTDKTPLGTMLSILMSYEVLARYLELELKKYGINLTRFNIMSTLYKNGGEMTPSEIAESVFREKNSITAVINALEKEGVVRREPSSNDRRSVKVVITEKGWKEANRLNPIAQELSRQTLSCMQKGQVEDLISTMRTVRDSLMPRITKSPGR